VAAYFVTELFVRFLISGFMGASVKRQTACARLTEAVPSNHGRAEFIAVRLEDACCGYTAGEAVDTGEGDFNGAAGVDDALCFAASGDGAPIAFPVRSKSGLIASLAGVHGYIHVPRDCEGLARGAKVTVTYF
jgi:molybdopterin molybdotransferase